MRPLLHPAEQEKSRSSLAVMKGIHPRAILEVASEELGDWLMKRICLGWEEGFKQDGGFLASEAPDAAVSRG